MTTVFPDITKTATQHADTRSFGTAIYCISEGAGMPVKLGISDNINNRIQMMRTHSWRPVTAYWAHWGGINHERALLSALADHRIRNEWFVDADDSIKNLMAHNLPADGIAWPLKMAVQNALRRKPHSALLTPGIHRGLSVTHEKQFECFDEAYRSEWLALLDTIGLAAFDAKFAPRDGREIEAALQKVAA